MCNTESKLLDQSYDAGWLQGRSNAGGPSMVALRRFGDKSCDFYWVSRMFSLGYLSALPRQG